MAEPSADFAVGAGAANAGTTSTLTRSEGDGTTSAAPAPPRQAAAIEARVLADRILHRESEDLLLDGARQRALSHEIERVLALIRHRHPAMAEVSARAGYLPGALTLGLEGDLSAAVADRWGDGESSAVPRTGHAAFDGLNAQFGLRGVRVYAFLGAVSLALDERANIGAAMRAYAAIDGVEYVEPDVALGDGPDVEAAAADGLWHVVFRKAWGDCPAGCIYEELSFFTVEGERIERVEPAQARGMAAFATLLAGRGWR